MRKIRQVLRLALEANQSQRSIASSLGISRDAVSDYLTRAATARLNWPLPPELNDEDLERQLFPKSSTSSRLVEPDWPNVHVQMKIKGATLAVLHQEFLESHPAGIGYSLFCERYKKWQASIKRYIRQNHTAGDRVFVDYAGKTMKIYQQGEQEPRHAQIFVGILGATNYTYAEAHWSQKLPDWISAHTRMFDFFGGAPRVVVCDNLKSAVTKASRSEPVINSAYQHLCEHYCMAVIPARPHEPKDKGSVENAVLIVERWILFRLRKRVFYSLDELNVAIKELLVDLNNRPFQKMAGSRKSLFDSIERKVLQPLPEKQFEYTEFHKVRIGPDGRFTVHACTYSAPANLSNRQVDVRVTTEVIEILDGGHRIASHQRGYGSDFIIDPNHLDPVGRYFTEWDGAADLEWASSIGPNANAFLQVLFLNGKAKEQGYRASLAFRKIATDFDHKRLEVACARAIALNLYSLPRLRSILRLKLEQLTDENPREANFVHANIRGSGHYH